MNVFDFVLAVSAWQGLVEGALISHIIYWAVTMLDFFQTGVAKVVLGNRSDNHCNRSDAWLSIIPLKLYQQTPCSLPRVCVVVLRTGQTK